MSTQNEESPILRPIRRINTALIDSPIQNTTNVKPVNPQANNTIITNQNSNTIRRNIPVTASSPILRTAPESNRIIRSTPSINPPVKDTPTQNSAIDRNLSEPSPVVRNVPVRNVPVAHTRVEASPVVRNVPVRNVPVASTPIEPSPTVRNVPIRTTPVSLTRSEPSPTVRNVPIRTTPISLTRSEPSSTVRNVPVRNVPVVSTSVTHTPVAPSPVVRNVPVVSSSVTHTPVAPSPVVRNVPVRNVPVVSTSIEPSPVVSSNRIIISPTLSKPILKTGTSASGSSKRITISPTVKIKENDQNRENKENVNTSNEILRLVSPVIRRRDGNNLDISDDFEYPLTYDECIPIYPDVNDPQIQEKITVKKEFNENPALRIEDEPSRGYLYNHQITATRLAINLGNKAFFHKAGTGKACIITKIAEIIKELYPEYDRAVICQRGPSTVSDMKHQILCKCTPPGTYETEAIRKASGETARKHNITRELRKWYNIKTYAIFAKEISKLSDEVLRAKYNGTVLFLDEVHNLGNDKSEKNKQTSSVVYDQIKRLCHVVKRIRIFVFSATPMINETLEFPKVMNLVLPPEKQLPLNWNYNSIIYEQLEPYVRGYISYVKNLDTGVDINYVGDLIQDHFEVMLPDPVAAPIWWEQHKSQFVNEEGIAKNDLKPMIPMKEHIIKPSTKVVRTYMSNHQKKVYYTTGTESFSIKQRRAAAGVFPDGTYGGTFKRSENNKDKTRQKKRGRPSKNSVKKEPEEYVYNEHEESTTTGLSKYVRSDSQDNYVATKELKEYIGNGTDAEKIARIAELSCKFGFVLDKEYNSTGCAFVYSSFLTGFGAIFLGICFEQIGFERYKPEVSAFKATTIEGKSICDTTSERELDPSITKKRRYAFLTSENTNKGELIRELFNSHHNLHGEYIQLIIGSELSRDGINLSHGQRVYIISSQWNSSSIYQAIHRILRSTSHIPLLKQKQKNKYEELIAEGMSSEEAIEIAKEERISVDVYKLVAIAYTEKNENVAALKKDNERSPGTWFLDFCNGKYIGYKNFNSVDIRLYNHSERKDIHIKYLERLYKKIAVDAYINIDRNIRKTDQDYTYDADYAEAKYIENFSPHKIDFSTYDIKYGEEILQDCIDNIFKLIREISCISINKLLEMWEIDDDDLYYPPKNPDKPRKEIYYRKETIYKAIDKIISEKMQFMNKFGYPHYLYTDGISVYMQKDFPTSDKEIGNSELYIYSNTLTGMGHKNYDDIVTDEQVDRQMEYIHRLKNLGAVYETNVGIEEFEEIMDGLLITTKVKLLEDAILNYNSPMNRSILHLYKRYVIEMSEPTDDIRAITKEIEKGKKSTLTPKFLSKLKGAPNKGEIDQVTGKEYNTVWIHKLYSLKKSLTNYGTLSKIKNMDYTIRILGPDNTWRNADKFEKEAYKNILSKMITDEINRYKESYITFGIVTVGKFAVYNRYINKTKLKKDGTERLNSVNGKNISTVSINELISMVFTEDIPIEYESKYNNTKQGLINYLSAMENPKFGLLPLNEYSLQELQRMHAISNYSQQQLAQILQKHLRDTGKYIVLEGDDE